MTDRVADRLKTCQMCAFIFPYLGGKVVYDSYGDTSIKTGRAQRDHESITYKHLEAPVCTDLNKTTAPITTNLKRYKTDIISEAFHHRPSINTRLSIGNVHYYS